MKAIKQFFKRILRMKFSVSIENPYDLTFYYCEIDYMLPAKMHNLSYKEAKRIKEKLDKDMEGINLKTFIE